MYNPACFKCRAEEGKPVENIKQESLCLKHLKARVIELESENAELREELKAKLPRLTFKSSFAPGT